MHTTDRASRIASTPLRAHAVTVTPAEATGHSYSPYRAVRSDHSCSCINGESAAASSDSDPARRSLALRPACPLCRFSGPFFIGVLQSVSLHPWTAPFARELKQQLQALAGAQGLSTAHI